MLYIVSTPIGNLKDITLRALEVLQTVDTILCEDSRRTGLLLNHYKIKKSILTINDYNETNLVNHLIQRLSTGENMALVSDAGTPLISDPGYKLIRECLQEQIEVDAIPGASSIIDALVLSGLPPDKFLFLGYLPEKPGKRQNFLKNLVSIHQTLAITYIAFVAPHKLQKTLTDLLQVFGDINITLAHELTKIHQSIDSQSVSKLLTTISQKKPKGEYVLLFHLD